MKRIGLGSFAVFKQRSHMQFAWGFRSCFFIRWCFDGGMRGETNQTEGCLNFEGRPLPSL